jgi:hypothetical protein
LSLSIAIAFLLGFISLLASGTTGYATKTTSYATVKPQIQNAVIAYMSDHNGELPPHQGTYDISSYRYNESVALTCDVIDICSLIGGMDLLRAVPDGCYGEKGEAGTNFYSGECDNPNNCDYIWLMDEVGNVYSTCIGDKCDANNEDGYQYVWCGVRYDASPGLLSEYWIVITVGLFLLLLFILAIVSIALRTQRKRKIMT